MDQSHPPKSAARRNLNCWSNLPPDLTKLVFDRLSFADFQRAKSVCSSWRSGSRQSQPNNQIPWMISFPRDQNHCLLFNPEEKEKLYKTRDFSDDFAKSFCVTTHRSWLLMLDPKYGDYCKSEFQEDHRQYNLYILHLLTGERIILPTLEAEFCFTPPVFWIDEKSKDYLVIKMFDEETTVSLKKGDNSWKQIPHLSLSGIEESSNLLYKDDKLYCLIDYKLKVFDLSREIPLLVFEISVDGCILRAVGHPRMGSSIPLKLQLPYSKKNVVVTLSGDILIVNSFRRAFSGTKDIHGVIGNSIYFTGPDFEDPYNENDIFVFNLNTNKVEKPHQFVSSSIPFYSCWFLPSFKP